LKKKKSFGTLGLVLSIEKKIEVFFPRNWIAKNSKSFSKRAFHKTFLFLKKRTGGLE
jgi:hypothetical protein